MTKVVRAEDTRWVFLLKTYAFAFTTTALIWALVAWRGGLQDTILVIELTLLEVAFSFDNAIVNSKFVKRLSKPWQFAFMTVGIFVAVFVVRFLLPLIIVQQATHLGLGKVFDMAVHHQALYAYYFTKASPIIQTFGGAFLLTAGISFLLEKAENIAMLVMLVITIAMYLTVPGGLPARSSVLAGGICGLTLHIGLKTLGDLLKPKAEGVLLTGLAALMLFVRGEVVDASFSFDGVLGAFAITQSIILIMAGLGAGATWVRSMTVHVVRKEVLEEFPHLEAGAMSAISLLGGSLLAERYDLETPSWAVGSIGLVCIAISIATSIIANKRASSDN